MMKKYPKKSRQSIQEVLKNVEEELLEDNQCWRRISSSQRGSVDVNVASENILKKSQRKCKAMKRIYTPMKGVN